LEHELLRLAPVLVYTELIAIERGQLYLASELPSAARRPSTSPPPPLPDSPKLPPRTADNVGEEEREEGGTREAAGTVVSVHGGFGLPGNGTEQTLDFWFPFLTPPAVCRRGREGESRAVSCWLWPVW